MNNDQLLNKLNRTAKSLSNHVGRGNTLNGMRSQDLVDRYTDLKYAALEADIWVDYCGANGYSPEHDAYDFFA